MMDIVELIIGVAILWMAYQLIHTIEYNDKEINKGDNKWIVNIRKYQQWKLILIKI